MSNPHHLAALGGTFDHLHSGHQHLLTVALSQADNVILGLVKNPNFKVFPGTIQSYPDRLAGLHQFIASVNSTRRVNCMELTDVYGPTLTDSTIDLLVVSELTQKGAEVINAQRANKRLPPLPVKVVSIINAQDGLPLSSSRIRAGEIDRLGLVYKNLFHKDLQLTGAGRQELKNPQGELLTSLNPALVRSSYPVVLVGDRVMKAFLDAKLPFTHAVIDGHIERQPVTIPKDYYTRFSTHHQINPPGKLQSLASTTIADIASLRSQLVIVTGEEDLLVFPVVLTYPLGTKVFYGQPETGIVMIEVNEVTKQKVLKLLNQFFILD